MGPNSISRQIIWQTILQETFNTYTYFNQSCKKLFLVLRAHVGTKTARITMMFVVDAAPLICLL